MKKHILFLLPAIFIGTASHAASTCSRANLTRCLDSACAINISSNPAARCQYCGTSSAGAPNTKSGLRSVSVGASAKYNISDKDLKKAPTEPGERYAWATAQCMKKVAGCTADDVSEAYDSLIEQSCKAAGVSAKLEQTLQNAAKKKSFAACQAEVRVCITADKYCSSDWRNCEANADFDKFFTACSVESNECSEHFATIRTGFISDRDQAIKNADTVLQRIVTQYQNAREQKLTGIKARCADNTDRDNCIESVCNSNMPNKCGEGFESEKSAAVLMCKFYEIACATID